MGRHWGSADCSIFKVVEKEGDTELDCPRFGSNVTISYENPPHVSGIDISKRTKLIVQTPSSFVLGMADNEVDRNVEEAVKSMYIGEKSRFTFIITIEEKLEGVPLKNWSHERKLGFSKDLLSSGTSLFKEFHTVDAFHNYRKAAALMALHQSNSECKKLYWNSVSNIVACHFRWRNFNRVVELASVILKDDNPQNLKRDLKKVLELEPENKAAQEKLQVLRTKVKNYNEKMSKLLMKGLINLHNITINRPYAAIILNTPIDPVEETIYSFWKKASFRATVDGGTDRWKEFETLSYYKSRGISSIVHTPDQDFTDFTKCLIEIKKRRQDLKSFFVHVQHSGRLDQIFVNSNSISWLLNPGESRIEYIPNKNKTYVGLIPIGTPIDSISTTGLRWNLDNGRLAFGELVSTSNEVDGNGLMIIKTSGDLLLNIRGMVAKKEKNLLALTHRGLIQEIFPSDDVDKVASYLLEKPRTVYAGFDPTASSLHEEQLVESEIQVAKKEERSLLSEETVEKNVEGISQNIQNIFNNYKKYFSHKQEELEPLILLDNDNWYRKMNVVDFMTNVGRHMRVCRMLSRQNTFQAYDWLYLLQNYDCRFQIGGSDQMVRRVRQTDQQAAKLLPLFTFRPLKEINDLIESGTVRKMQSALAEDITLLVHGQEGLEKALKTTQIIFHNDLNALSEINALDLKDIFKQAPYIRLLYENGISVLDLAKKINCFRSEADAIRVVSAGGFYINHERKSNIDEIILPEYQILKNNVSLVRVGKRNYFIIEWTL
ncbi:YARS [Lepeophtheirus salmonis]|uniref:Tyrosyl-tRNA synthetase n=1 Tax=Lepeophtheirus salmonis TaxID=72036 RepID=A0A7R8CTM3_LEPSM|nr:YARS [Lepeophtheirus salmonis]CAF2890186.1 YARS [Lepeophtheirus salmonis]